MNIAIIAVRGRGFALHVSFANLRMTYAQEVKYRTLSRPLIEDARALPDRVATARSAAGLGLKDLSGSIERIASEQHALDALAVLAPLFDLASDP
jgi:hypothetical protein